MLNGVYEIVIYTAELGMTVFPILEALDPQNLITYKLVRDATNFTNGHHVKELSKLNRNLEKVSPNLRPISEEKKNRCFIGDSSRLGRKFRTG